jgi:hypothetical protein
MDKTKASCATPVFRRSGARDPRTRHSATSDFIDAVEEAFPTRVREADQHRLVGGVHKVHSRAHFVSAIKDASRYDHDVLVEPGLDAREIECAVLGGFEPQASALGEIRYTAEFYDYEAKYAAESTQLLIPADVTPAQNDEMRALALRSFRALKCWGMARVDFFLERKTAARPERDQHDSRLHHHQHVSEALGGERPGLRGARRPPDRLAERRRETVPRDQIQVEFGRAQPTESTSKELKNRNRSASISFGVAVARSISSAAYSPSKSG